MTQGVNQAVNQVENKWDFKYINNNKLMLISLFLFVLLTFYQA